MASKQKKQFVQEDNPAKGEWIRRFKANPFVFIGTIVVLIIVIIAFVLVPAIVPSAGGPVADLTFGSYNRVPINYVPGNYFSQVQENIARYMQNSISENNYQMANYQIWREAFEETVIHTGILDEMKSAGYKAPENVVDREVARLPQFQENGRFSITRYRKMDNTTRIALWREVQDSFTEQRYRSDITGLRIPSKEGAFIRAMAERERRFTMAVLPFSTYPNEEIAAYALAHPELFRITHLSKITVNSSDREARQVLASIKDGTRTFEEAAQAQSQDSYADRGGDMGSKMAFELSSEVPDAQEREGVIATAPGEYSPIVKVPSGWAFFRIEEASYPSNAEDPLILDKIRTYMMDFERGHVEDWLIGQAREFSAALAESDFDSALAEKEGLEKRSFGPVPLNYGGLDLFTTLASQSVTELLSAESNENFWRIAFSTPLNTPSEPLVIGNTVLVLYPEEEIIKDEAALGNIETIYSSYWISYNADQNLRSYFLNNGKLDDKFMSVFLQYFWQSN
jgi:hypothetical protein